MDTLEEDLSSLDAGLSLPVDEELPKSLSMSSRVSDDELDKVSSSGEVDEWSSEEQAEKMARIADGVIVGSAIIKILAAHGKDAAEPVGDYVRSMKEAITF